MKARLKETYFKEILPKLQNQLGIKNSLAVPKLSKIVISCGLGRFARDQKVFDEACENIALIACQKPVIRAAKKSISEFSVREGMPSGIMVTLRRDSMYNFLDRFINIAMPRSRDFGGFKSKAFDGNGNFNIGIKEQNIFPEVDYLKASSSFGLNITIVTTSDSDEHSMELLKMFNFPFNK